MLLCLNSRTNFCEVDCTKTPPSGPRQSSRCRLHNSTNSEWHRNGRKKINKLCVVLPRSTRSTGLSLQTISRYHPGLLVHLIDARHGSALSAGWNWRVSLTKCAKLSISRPGTSDWRERTGTTRPSTNNRLRSLHRLQDNPPRSCGRKQHLSKSTSVGRIDTCTWWTRCVNWLENGSNRLISRPKVRLLNDACHNFY
jgi:hypothetical protein